MSEKQPPAHGTFMWNELATTDVEAAKKFYGDLLGWQFDEMDMGEAGKYTILKAGDKQAGGLMAMEGPQWEGIPPHWMSYIAVDDVDACAQKAGDNVKVPPFDIPGVGRMCVIVDPQGAAISLMTPGS